MISISKTTQTDRLPGQNRQLNYNVTQLTTNIHHIPGSSNQTADMLSRINTMASINYTDMTKEQKLAHLGANVTLKMIL